MLRLLAIYILLIIGVCGTVGADTPPAAAPEKKSATENIKEDITQVLLTDNSFVRKATIASRAEIELSKLALKKSQNAAVRSFAQRMIKDHAAAAETLKDIAQSRNIDVPGELDSAHEETVTRLDKLSGAEFDSAYIEQMHKDHDKAVSLFSAASGDKSLAQELIGFARRTLPTLRDHQQAADGLHAH